MELGKTPGQPEEREKPLQGISERVLLGAVSLYTNSGLDPTRAMQAAQKHAANFGPDLEVCARVPGLIRFLIEPSALDSHIEEAGRKVQAQLNTLYEQYPPSDGPHTS